jgi:hypothetical protein
LSGSLAVAYDTTSMTDWTLRLVACAGLLALVGRVPADASPNVVLGVGLAASVLLVVCVAAVALVRRRLTPARITV